MTSLFKLSLSTFRDTFTHTAVVFFPFYLKSITLKREPMNMTVNHDCVGVWSLVDLVIIIKKH